MADNKKTLHDFKLKEAWEYSSIIYKKDLGWNELCLQLIKDNDYRLIPILLEKAAERYAQYLAGEAYVKGYDDGKIGYFNNPYKQKEGQ